MVMRARKRGCSKCTIDVHPTPFHATRRPRTNTGTAGQPARVSEKVPNNVGHDAGWQRKPHGRPRATPTTVTDDGGHGPDGKRTNHLHPRASTTSRDNQKEEGHLKSQADRHRQSTICTPVEEVGSTRNQQSVVVPRANPSPLATQPHPRPTARARPAASVTCLGAGA